MKPRSSTCFTWVRSPWRRLLLGAIAALAVIAAGAGDAEACRRVRCRAYAYPVYVVYVSPVPMPRAYPPVVPGGMKPPAEKIPPPRESKEGEKPPVSRGNVLGRMPRAAD